MNVFFDLLETRDPAAREAALMAALPAQLRAAQATAAFGDRLAGIDAAAITSRAALAALPVTRKSQLLERQRATAFNAQVGAQAIEERRGAVRDRNRSQGG